MRAQLLDQLRKAVMATSTERDQLAQKAVATYYHYKKTFSEEEQMIRFHDKTEGTARYVEVASALRSSYKEVTSIETQLAAAAVYYQAPDTYRDVGAVNEAYVIGEATGFLLDYYFENQSEWKWQLIRETDLTPMELLATHLSDDELTPLYEAPAEEFATQIRAAVAGVQNGSADWKAIIGLVYHLIF